MSQDIGDTRTCECRFGCCSFGLVSCGSFGCSGGLVVAAGVEDEFAEEFAGGGVDDADVEVLDDEDDAGSGVGSSDADVVQSTVVPQGDGAGFDDAVVPDPFVGLGVGGRDRVVPWASSRRALPGSNGGGVIGAGAGGCTRW